MALQPQLPSLHKLRFLASRQPVDTFYRASDLTLGHFEALVFVPASELAQCRLTVVNAYKSVHDAIREFGDQDSIEDEVSEMMDKVMELIKDIEQHAEIDESFENDLASLRTILQERPKVDGAKYTIINKGTAYGQNAGHATFKYGTSLGPTPNFGLDLRNENR